MSIPATLLKPGQANSITPTQRRARKFCGVVFEIGGDTFPAIWGWRGFHAGDDGSNNVITTGDGYPIGEVGMSGPEGPPYFNANGYPGGTPAFCTFPVLPIEWGLWRDHSGTVSDWQGGSYEGEQYQMQVGSGITITTWTRLYHPVSVLIRVDEYKVAHLITSGEDVQTITLDASYDFSIPANATTSGPYTAPTDDTAPDPLIEGSAWNTYKALVKIAIPKLA